LKIRQLLASLVILLPFAGTARANPLVDAFRQLQPLTLGAGPTQWKAVSFLPLFDSRFPTFHPQGIKLLGRSLFLSTVQGQDTGFGHLIRYQLDSAAHPRAVHAVGQVTFPPGPDGRLIHAGGLDGDGTRLFVPLASYRREGPAEIVEVSTANLAYRAIAWLNDHVGTLAYGRDERELHLFDWSTGLYSVPFSRLNFETEVPLELEKRVLSSDWEYQDCKSVGDGYAICSAKKGALWPVGEIHLVRFRRDASGHAGLEVLHRVPVPSLRSDGSPNGSRPLTYNAMDVAAIRSTTDPSVITGLRFYFVPYDDQASRLMVFDAYVKPVGTEWASRL
jgi:hypothetical protein